MARPVTTFGPSELASKLEELSELASQIFRCSVELRTRLQSDPLADNASACTLLHVALLNAQGCLSLLQSVNPAPISSYVVPSPDVHPVDFPCSPTSPFVPPVVCSPRSLTPNSIVSCTFFFFTHQSRLLIGPLLAVPTDLSLLSWSSQPATQRWPHQSISPSFKTVIESPTLPSPGGRSANDYSPSPPFINLSRTRHDITIAKLVDEENLVPGTRGGVNRPSRPAAMAQTIPPLQMSFVDVTPRSAMSRVIRSSPRSPPISPASDHRPRTTGEAGEAPRRSRRKAGPLTVPEATGRRVTRSIIKREATDDLEMEARSPKRARSAHPDS